MTFRFSSAALTAALCASVAFPAVAEPVFNRVASFAVALNLPSDKDEKTVTSAEIITASEDGNTLIYSDSPLGGIGFIDIKDAKAPKPLGALMMDGEPTSVITSGSKVLAGVNTSESFVKPSGKLVTVDIATKKIEASCELGGQPDSVAVSPDKSFVAIAIENERDEKVNEGALPQMPAGFLVTIGLKDGAADCSTLKKIDVNGLAEISPEDPEPEFVSINTNGEIALTLQENNHIVIIDGKSGKVTNHFSAGTVDLDGIDAKSDGQLKFTDSQKARKREPDAVKWLDNNRIVIANEGDWEGGSRGFTIFDKTGKLVYEAGASLEHAVAAIGHYPEKRSKAKGIEPEGLETATFGNDKYFFVLAERASVVGVYKDTGAEPELKQLLPSGISPEGAVAIPSRNLLVTANEADLVEDGGARSHVMIYERAEGQAAYPQLTSATVDGAPIGWGALSGLVGDADKDGILYAISDSVYGNQPSIYTIDATQKPALITSVLRVKRDGQPAQKLDMEGITLDGKGGFWVASEGNSEKLVPHALYNINAKGEIKTEIALPKELREGETRFGFEGITLIGKGDDATLWMAVQREWGNDEKGTVKLVSYNLKSKEWGAVHYPLDKTGDGWVGLSEITAHGDKVYIVERDNQIGEKAKIKKLYSVAIADLKPGKIGGALPLVKKTEAHDFLPDLKAQTNGYVVDKLEGFAFDKSGKAFAVTDNDGVDDSSGETLFFPVDLKGTN
ncbi:esterase-like activity of phytase family protein [Agrobacterium rubi]|uniref:esterase-like activity of phytase family protein n=1 Tax=Agrobacterium rubi TaxID=28099 RepID=UPI00157473A4|nr:esterase-like activity of phytase family protein [Agrobacterium rubi]NTF07240.1 esterase-like activity of phytase family protein [Agrobacterium rubi]NTF19496.1 esterase-like activity of phytase family protein [Agrobacterium rubi]NTF26459.1 esterase-like activity of phytase family protein [Agrobacterium rubi]